MAFVNSSMAKAPKPAQASKGSVRAEFQEVWRATK